MEKKVICPECGSDQVLNKSSVPEFNPDELLICCKCMCQFKDGKIFRTGRNFKAINRWKNIGKKEIKRLVRKAAKQAKSDAKNPSVAS